MEQPSDVPTRRRPARLSSDLALLGVVALVLVAALGAGGVTLYREFYSPSAFVTRYLDLLAQHRASDALRLPGVALDREALDGDAAAASDALLRGTALAPLTDYTVVDEHVDGDETLVTVEYRAGGHAGRTTFHVAREGWLGVAPTWRFSQSPLAVVSLTVRGAEQFTVNGFELDRRQVAAGGVDAPPLEPVPLLVFSPGLYSVSVDTPMSATPGIGVLADAPGATVPVDVQAQPTDQFVQVVQQRVDEFLTQCATQQVLMPAGCPFGMTVQNKLASDPHWSIVEMPKVSVEPDGANWRIPPTDAVAHIVVDVQSLYDGSIREVDEDVRFRIDATIQVLPDGAASIVVGSPDLPIDDGD